MKFALKLLAKLYSWLEKRTEFRKLNVTEGLVCSRCGLIERFHRKKDWDQACVTARFNMATTYTHIPRPTDSLKEEPNDDWRTKYPQWFTFHDIKSPDNEIT